MAASFGLASALSVVVLGDESGYTAGENQKMKIAAIEAMWETEPPPASFTVFGIPDLKSETTKYEIEIPWVLGLIATRSLDKPVEGVKALVERAEARIRNGMAGYQWLAKEGGHPQRRRSAGTRSLDARRRPFAARSSAFAPDIENATDAQIHEAALSTIPDVPVLFWSFRIMVALGFYFIALFAVAFYLSSERRCGKPWFLRMAMYSLPLPWVAAELGWIVAEYGRQPWIIDGAMPTFLGVSNVPASNVAASLAAFVLFYSALAIVDVGLIVKYVRIGPREEAEPSAQARPCFPRRRRRKPDRKGESDVRLYDASPHLVGDSRRPAHRLRRHGRLRLGVAMLHPFVARNDTQRRVMPEHDRSGLGRQPGLVHSRRRRHLRGLAAALCGVLLRLLSCDVAGADRPHPAAGGDHLPRQESRDAAGARPGTGSSSSSGFVPALIFGVAFGNLLQGVPFHFDQALRATYEGGLLGLLNPFALALRPRERRDAHDAGRAPG